MKKLNLGLVIMLCLLLFKPIFAEELNQDQLVATDGLMCTMDAMICPDGTAVSRIPEQNCEFAPCPQYDGSQETNIEETTGIQRNNCQEELNTIEKEIKEITEKYRLETDSLRKEYSNRLADYKRKRENFTICLNQKIASRITGNLVVSSASRPQEVTTATNKVVTSGLTISSADSVVPISDDSIYFPEILSQSIPNLPEKTTENCKDEAMTAKLAHTELLKIIEEIKNFSIKNNKDFEKTKELKERHRAISVNCNKPVIQYRKECSVPEELLIQEKTLKEELTQLQQNYLGTTNNKQEDQEFILKYQEIKKRYILVEEKIKTLRKECATPPVVTQSECKDQEIINAITEIKKLLLEEKDEKTTYELKTKLEYYLRRQEKCNLNLPSQADSKELEIKMYREEINKLRDEIESKNKIIKDLKANLDAFRTEYKNAGQERKAEVLANNAVMISEHTVEILDKKILELNKKISAIESNQNLDPSQKSKMIDSINQRIADLELNKSNINLAMTPEEIKNAVANARLSEAKANNAKRISDLQKSLEKLKEIISKHFTNNQNLNAKINSLNEKLQVTDSTENNTNELIAEYLEIKEEIKGEINE